MKYIYHSFVFMVFVMPCIVHAPIKELFQFQQRLQTLTTFLGKSQTTTPVKKPTITTYEELRKVVNTASTANNANLLDNYEPTIATLTAKYLLQEYFKEQTVVGKDADYIPFIAYMVQQVTERYPDKNTELHCISLDQNNQLEEKLLENEFLLIRALVHLGYKNIIIIPMNLWYKDFDRENLQNKFNTWVTTNIPVALKNKIVLGLLDKTEYTYISEVKKGDAPKNNLFFMLGSFNRSMQKEESTALLSTLPFIFKDLPNINFFNFEKAQASEAIKIYMPYDPSDIFITSSILNTTDQINTLKNIIKNTGLDKPFYQHLLIEFLIKNFYDSILGPEIARGRIGVNIDLFFLDLIKHTAVDPTKPLAFRGLGANIDMTEIKDMSGTLQQVYDRYKRP